MTNTPFITKADTEMNARILVVDDEEDIQDVVVMALQAAGFGTVTAADGQEGFVAAVDQRPDLAIVDWMMPNVNGLELLRRLRRDERTVELPVIMLTAKTEINHRTQGLDEGADDYLGKPFSPKELVSRVKAVLRRSTGQESASGLSARNLLLDVESHRVFINGQQISIGPTEFKLLHFFLSHRDRVYSRQQLLDQVWGTNVYIDERTVDVHIRRLRKAIAVDDHDKCVQTVRGSGYRFSETIH